MDSETTKAKMLAGAEELRRLNSRIKETLKSRDRDGAGLLAWQSVCAEFQSRYNELAFPGGLTEAIERLTAGDSATIDQVLCYLECRPYFFRSGYQFDNLLRKIKHVSLNEHQRIRLNAVLEARERHRRFKMQPVKDEDD